MAWLYVPGQEGLSSDCTWPSEMPIGLSLAWNGKLLLSRSWSRASKTAPFPRFLSGIALPPSTADRGVASWISSLAASRASRSVWLDRSGEMLTPGISGHTSPGSSGSASQRWSSLRTFRDCSTLPLLTDQDTHTSWLRETYSAWVTGLRAASSRRRKSVPLTSENGSSSWPSATSHDGRRPGADIRSTQGGNLSREAALWPSPRSEDSESAGNHPGAVDSLTGAMGLWQTPASDSFRSRGGDRKDEQGLDQQARGFEQWGTPSSREWKGAHPEHALTRKDGKSRMDLLGNQAVYWQTPTAGDEVKTSSRMREGHHNSLKAQVLSGSQPFPPDPETGRPGRESSPSTPSTRRVLNPVFVEMLMGWRPGWTSLEPLGSGSPATGSCPHRPSSLSEPYGGR